MTNTHTPGPWVTKGPHILEEIPSFNYVASVQASNMPEWEANARLIAAAPDLLAALQAVADYWAGGDVPADIDAAMRAAIAKATGQ